MSSYLKSITTGTIPTLGAIDAALVSGFCSLVPCNIEWKILHVEQESCSRLKASESSCILMPRLVLDEVIHIAASPFVVRF